MISQRNFANYDITELAQSPQGVYGLADGLLSRIAEKGFKREIAAVPSEEELQDLVGLIGQAKELQKNIPGVEERLGTSSAAIMQAVHWVDRSGVLLPLNRSFASPETHEPNDRTVLVMTGGVARWMLRRLFQVEIMASQSPDQIGEVHLMTGNRQMGSNEHELVGILAEVMDKEPTESDFAAKILMPRLARLGLSAKHAAVDSGTGEEIFGEGISRHPNILESKVTVVGNAPSAVMATGQFYLEAYGHDHHFNSNGDQLFMVADSYPVAITEHEAKIPATFQNPYTALGQIARNGLLLHRAANAFATQ